MLSLARVLPTWLVIRIKKTKVSMLDSLQIIKSKLNYKPTKLHIFEDIHNCVVPHAIYAPK